MSHSDQPTPMQRFVRNLLESRTVGWLANTPPIAWLLRVTTRNIARRSLNAPGAAQPPKAYTAAAVGKDESIPSNLDTGSKRPSVRMGGTDLDDILGDLAADVVRVLGYVGAMVAPVEDGDELPVRAFYVNPSIATLDQIRAWEAELSKWTPRPISITNPAVARVNLSEASDQVNLSAKAARMKSPIIDTRLFSLFTPIVPAVAQPVVKGIQQSLGIVHVIAYPFFLEVEQDGEYRQEMVGNLFAARAQPITDADIKLLAAFARQAAAAIESERRRKQAAITEHIVSILHQNIEDEQKLLQEIVQRVTRELNYVGAIVATYEDTDKSLPVRAYHIDPACATPAQIYKWEANVSQYGGRTLSLSDPDVARVELNRQYHRDNLSIQAVKAGVPVTSPKLYDLLRPFVPPAGEAVVQGVQEAMGIQQVIAVPFYIRGGERLELMGNLFAATRSAEFSVREREMLKAFGEQAAIGIKNARMYRQSEERRAIAQALGMEAFTSAAYAHELGNLVGVVGTWISFLSQMEPQTPEQYEDFYRRYQTHIAPLTNKFDEVKKILASLHQPWRHRPQNDADFRSCLERAAEKGVERVIEQQGKEAEVKIRVNMERVPDDLPLIPTSPDMLRQALVSILQNSTEAIMQRGNSGRIQVEASVAGSYIDVTIKDDGIGMKRATQRRMFELQYTTKDTASHRGFGLFWTKDYIEGMGGSITIISRWNEGTVVQLKLPATPPGDELGHQPGGMTA